MLGPAGTRQPVPMIRSWESPKQVGCRQAACWECLLEHADFQSLSRNCWDTDSQHRPKAGKKCCNALLWQMKTSLCPGKFPDTDLLLWIERVSHKRLWRGKKTQVMAACEWAWKMDRWTQKWALLDLSENCTQKKSSNSLRLQNQENQSEFLENLQKYLIGCNVMI